MSTEQTAVAERRILLRAEVETKTGHTTTAPTNIKSASKLVISALVGIAIELRIDGHLEAADGVRNAIAGRLTDPPALTDYGFAQPGFFDDAGRKLRHSAHGLRPTSVEIKVCLRSF